MEKHKKTITIRLSLPNRPLDTVLADLAEDTGVTLNKYIEEVLVRHVKNKGITWVKPIEL
jgi:hypothetical protein